MIKDYLKNLNLFKSLSEEDLEYISSCTKERVFKKNSIVVSEGNKRNFIYIIKSGKVKLYKSSNEGENIILQIKGEGSILGLSILFSDLPNPSTVMTAEDSTILVIKACDLEKLITSNNDLSVEVIKNINNKLLSAQKKLIDIALDNSYTKVVKLLLRLSKEHGRFISYSSCELDLGLTRTELASFIGLSRETFSRTLSQLNKEGVIDIYDKKIIVRDKLKECLK